MDRYDFAGLNETQRRDYVIRETGKHGRKHQGIARTMHTLNRAFPFNFSFRRIATLCRAAASELNRCYRRVGVRRIVHSHNLRRAAV